MELSAYFLWRKEKKRGRPTKGRDLSCDRVPSFPGREGDKKKRLGLTDIFLVPLPSTSHKTESMREAGGKERGGAGEGKGAVITEVQVIGFFGCIMSYFFVLFSA